MTEKFTSDSGKEYVIGEQLAYRGREDCDSPFCTRMGFSYDPEGNFVQGVCVGWHCPRCDEPCSMMGHDCD